MVKYSCCACSGNCPRKRYVKVLHRKVYFRFCKVCKEPAWVKVISCCIMSSCCVFSLHRLIAIGEEFCGSKSETLHDSIRTQTVNYFKNYHRSVNPNFVTFKKYYQWKCVVTIGVFFLFWVKIICWYLYNWSKSLRVFLIIWCMNKRHHNIW